MVHDDLWLRVLRFTHSTTATRRRTVSVPPDRCRACPGMAREASEDQFESEPGEILKGKHYEMLQKAATRSS